jgi:hypothetical protein
MYVSRLEQELLDTTSAIEREDWEDAKMHARHNRDLLTKADALNYLCEDCVLVERREGEDGITYEQYDLCERCAARIKETGW